MEANSAYDFNMVNLWGPCPPGLTMRLHPGSTIAVIIPETFLANFFFFGGKKKKKKKKKKSYIGGLDLGTRLK